ncbi:MAG: hypothetical protein C0593_12980 [Marinilabiliales bacterium]|nr:MAG: hypothetical protein C0593_12980 [Marinilabiliales bacterium]
MLIFISGISVFLCLFFKKKIFYLRPSPKLKPMESQICPKAEKCPVLNKEAFADVKTLEYYKKNYCFTDDHTWVKCKRFITAQTLQMCPSFVMPDSCFSIDEILDRMENGEV